MEESDTTHRSMVWLLALGMVLIALLAAAALLYVWTRRRPSRALGMAKQTAALLPFPDSEPQRG